MTNVVGSPAAQEKPVIGFIIFNGGDEDWDFSDSNTIFDLYPVLEENKNSLLSLQIGESLTCGQLDVARNY